MGKSKKACQRLHAKARFKERFNIDLTTAQLRDMVGVIQSNKGKFIKRTSHRVSTWDILYLGSTYRVVYDSQRHVIVTVLRPNPTLVPFLANNAKEVGF